MYGKGHTCTFEYGTWLNNVGQLKDCKNINSYQDQKSCQDNLEPLLMVQRVELGWLKSKFDIVVWISSYRAKQETDRKEQDVSHKHFALRSFCHLEDCFRYHFPHWSFSWRRTNKFLEDEQANLEDQKHPCDAETNEGSLRNEQGKNTKLNLNI